MNFLMSIDEIVIDAINLSKRYEIYKTPRDRLKQLLLPLFYGVLGRVTRRQQPQYYREFWALHGISFQIRRGETLGILGRNGSGKSTLLQLICGTLSPSTGAVKVTGRISALLELGSGFNPEYTGRENVFLNGQILGLTRQEIESRYQAIVDFADIGDFIDEPIKTYSSGMVVRLAFSVAVNVEPEIFVVDEALAVGDMPFQIKCFAHLRKLRNSGTSILFVSHDISTIRSFCDRALYLDHGNCLAIGPANDVCRQYELDCLKNKLSPPEVEDIKVSDSRDHLERADNLISTGIFQYLNDFISIFSKNKHEGSQSVTIQSFVIVGSDGVPVESIEPRQGVTAYVLIRVNRPILQDFHVSIQIHDRQGMPLMVVRDSAFEDIIVGAEGDLLVASMCFSLPLKAGQYYCQAGVLLFPPGEKYAGDEFNFEHAEIADMVEHAAYIRILPYIRHDIPVAVLRESKMQVTVLKVSSS